jgi:hypothetical protein
MTISWATFFTRYGKLANAQNTVNLNRAPTTAGAFPKEINDYFLEFDNVSNDLEAVIDGLAPAVRAGQQSLDGVQSWLQGSATKLLLQTVKDDNPQLSSSDLKTNLKEFIRQMQADSQTVDASVPAATATAGASNNGNGKLVVSVKRGDGLVNENILAETITFKCSDNTTEGQEVFQATGQESATALSQDWPKGSGASRTFTACDAALGTPNLISNGSFENETLVSNMPDNWNLVVGTIGTTIKITDPEVQTVQIAGTPTSGTYTLTYTDASSRVQTTAPIAYNAASSDVQSALRLLSGLEAVTVTTSAGAVPDITHQITFLGSDHGNITQLTSVDSMSGGTHSITHATTTAGSAYVFKGGKALQFVGDGSQLTSIACPIFGLTALQQLAFCGWFTTDSAPAAGSLRVDLWDGSAVINDAQGVANSLTIDPTALTGSFVAYTAIFRTPRVLPPIVYLRFRVETAMTNTKNVFADHFALRPMEPMYAGGPEFALFSGSNLLPFRKGNDVVQPDSFSVAVTNGREGAIQESFQRNYGMNDLGLILPSALGGLETIDDAAYIT